MLQGAHPVMFEGFYESSGAHAEMHGRLARTARIMNIIYFASKEDADRQCRAVRAMHARVKGELTEPAGIFPAGTPYAADDPKYLLWTLASLWDSVQLFYQMYVHELSDPEKHRLWQDYRVVGELFGLSAKDMPGGHIEAEEYMQEMVEGDELYVTERSRESGRKVVLHPPAPIWMQPLVQAVNFAIIGSLPAKIREGYGLQWLPGMEEARQLGALYTRMQLGMLPGWVKNTPAAGGRLIQLAE